MYKVSCGWPIDDAIRYTAELFVVQKGDSAKIPSLGQNGCTVACTLLTATKGTFRVDLPATCRRNSFKTKDSIRTSIALGNTYPEVVGTRQRMNLRFHVARAVVLICIVVRMTVRSVFTWKYRSSSASVIGAPVLRKVVERLKLRMISRTELRRKPGSKEATSLNRAFTSTAVRAVGVNGSLGEQDYIRVHIRIQKVPVECEVELLL